MYIIYIMSLNDNTIESKDKVEKHLINRYRISVYHLRLLQMVLHDERFNQ